MNKCKQNRIKESLNTSITVFLTGLLGTLLFVIISIPLFLIILVSQKYSYWWILLLIPYFFVVIFFIDFTIKGEKNAPNN